MDSRGKRHPSRTADASQKRPTFLAVQFSIAFPLPSQRVLHLLHCPPSSLSLDPAPSSPAHAVLPTQPAGSVQLVSKQPFSGVRKGWAHGCSCQCCEPWPSACLHSASFVLVLIISWGLSQDAGRKCWVLDEQKSTLSKSFWRKWREKTYKRKIKMKYTTESPAHHLRWVHRFLTNEDLLKPTSRNPWCHLLLGLCGSLAEASVAHHNGQCGDPKCWHLEAPVTQYLFPLCPSHLSHLQG